MEDLPPEVLARVFCNLTVRDLRNGRNACKTWRQTIDAQAAMLWEARCRALRLFAAGPDTVLGACAEEVTSRALGVRRQLQCVEDSGKRRETLMKELVNLYRTFYRDWAQHVCNLTMADDLQGACIFCTAPDSIEWVHSRLIPRVLQQRDKVRSIRCPRPPHAPLHWRHTTGKLCRLDDLSLQLSGLWPSSRVKLFIERRIRENHFVVR